MSLKITILGCGNSEGVPAAGNYWGACNPHEPRNLRTRASIAVQSDTTTMVIDTGPDFRMQTVRENLTSLDAVFFTHMHADHIAGFDELRAYFKRTNKPIDVYGLAEHMDELVQRFQYQFEEVSPLYPVACVSHAFADKNFAKPHIIGDIKFTPFIQSHGFSKSIGFRFGDVAYSTDVVDLDEQAIEILRGVKTWIVDAAGYKMKRNRVHFTLEALYKMNERIGAMEVYMTHLSPAMDYQTLMNETPKNYKPAYDGLVVEV